MIDAASSVGGSASTLPDDRVAARSAEAGYNRANARLSSDEAPRGSAAEIAADQTAVRQAQQAVEAAKARLRSDGDHASLVNLVA